MAQQRIHLTDCKTNKSIRIDPPPGCSKRVWYAKEVMYDVTCCGETFADFSGNFQHSVYLIEALQYLLDRGSRHNLCPNCLESDTYAMYLLGR